MQRAKRTTPKDTHPSQTHPPNKNHNQDSPDASPPKQPPTTLRRTATLYDAVAGRIGLNGFLKATQPKYTSTSTFPPPLNTSTTTLRPEEVLLRRVNAPDKIPYDYYDADLRLDPITQRLPDSELLKEVHGYVSDYYETLNIAGSIDPEEVAGGPGVDFKSFDETALLAMGILLEEACKEALGENGDMVFSEPVRNDGGLPGSVRSRYQVIGRVVPEVVQEVEEEPSSSDGDHDDDDDSREALLEERPRKRARRRYREVDEF